MINFKNTKKLKYLFIAELTDGSFIKQTPDDKSKLDPTANCYHDLLKHLEETKLRIRRFSLEGEGNVVTVDLGTGVFRINGLPILVESDRLPILPDEFKLIWYHQVTQRTNVTVDLKTRGILKNDLQAEYREYFIGWQCTIKGKNYQQKIAVS